jgi:SAM-dependent methyltransferase
LTQNKKAPFRTKRLQFSSSRSNWKQVWQDGLSEREKRLGVIARQYVLPKYYELFQRFLKEKGSISILEVGAGSGEMTHFILSQGPSYIVDYMATELTGQGCAQIRSLGIQCEQMDAMALGFQDGAFDAVCSFDVMHHVPDPGRMAREMMRVACRYIFLIESNGLSLGRKLLEKTKSYRSLDENSYFPWQYRSFFTSPSIQYFEIHPFLFTIPKLPDFTWRWVAGFSELMEKIPLIRWQCSGVWMGIKKYENSCDGDLLL